MRLNPWRRRRAMLFVPLPAGSAAADRWRRACTAHAISHRYQIVTVTGDAAMVQLYLDRRAVEVVICGHLDHAAALADIHPRVEVVTDPPPQHPYARRTGRRRLPGGP